MKKKINRKLVLIATLAIFFTMLLITVVYYDLFRGQVFEDLRAYTMILTEYEDMSQIREVSDKLEEYEMRVTLVGEDGKVLFDSEADSASMENHGERPEIVEAMETGEGQAVRNSETLSENTFYYAVRLENGSVLRIAKDAGSIYSIFGRALPSLFMVLLALIVLCMVLAQYLTSKLIAPIERLAENLDESNDGTDYEELTPLDRKSVV